MKRIGRITRTGRAATVLIVFGAAVLTIVARGPVVAKGQQPTMIGDTTTDETGVASTSEHEGARLFRKETFGGNGRTCETCHNRSTGTLSPADVVELLHEDPSNALSATMVSTTASLALRGLPSTRPSASSARCRPTSDRRGSVDERRSFSRYSGTPNTPALDRADA